LGGEEEEETVVWEREFGFVKRKKKLVIGYI